ANRNVPDHNSSRATLITVHQPSMLLNFSSVMQRQVSLNVRPARRRRKEHVAYAGGLTRIRLQPTIYFRCAKGLPLFEIALVLVRPDDVAHIIVNADHGIGCSAWRSQLPCAGSRFPLILCWRWRISFEFRNRWVHLVPRLRVRNKNVHLRFEQTGVVQAARQHTEKGRISFFKLSTGDAGSTFGTKTALMFS